MSNAELACSYAALLLHDDGIEITADKIQAVLTAADVRVDSYWPGLFATFAQSANIDDLLNSVGSAPAAAPAAAGGAAPAAGGAAAAPKEEAKEESDDDMGLDLFD